MKKSTLLIIKDCSKCKKSFKYRRKGKKGMTRYLCTNCAEKNVAERQSKYWKIYFSLNKQKIYEKRMQDPDYQKKANERRRVWLKTPKGKAFNQRKVKEWYLRMKADPIKHEKYLAYHRQLKRKLTQTHSKRIK